MQQKRGKVTELKENAFTWQGKKGMVYYHEITFDNGDKGRYGTDANKCDFFVKGQECEYQIETRQNGAHTNTYVSPGKVEQAPAYNGQRNEGKIVAQSCFNMAVNFYMHKPDSNEESVIKFGEKLIELVNKYAN